MRLIQAGQRETVLNSKAIWLCATCETCTTRCPCEIDVAHIMDTLRNMAFREKRYTEKDIKTLLRILPHLRQEAWKDLRAGHPHRYNLAIGPPLGGCRLWAQSDDQRTV